jgi:hypothetical protein
MIVADYSIKVNGLVIPHFTSTEQALEWGARQKPSDLDTLAGLYKGLREAALNTRDLQRKADRATQAQFVREAASAVPVRMLPAPADTNGSAAQ